MKNLVLTTMCAILLSGCGEPSPEAKQMLRESGQEVQESSPELKKLDRTAAKLLGGSPHTALSYIQESAYSATVADSIRKKHGAVTPETFCAYVSSPEFAAKTADELGKQFTVIYESDSTRLSSKKYRPNSLVICPISKSDKNVGLYEVDDAGKVKDLNASVRVNVATSYPQAVDPR